MHLHVCSVFFQKRYSLSNIGYIGRFLIPFGLKLVIHFNRLSMKCGKLWSSRCNHSTILLLFVTWNRVRNLFQVGKREGLENHWNTRSMPQIPLEFSGSTPEFLGFPHPNFPRESRGRQSGVMVSALDFVLSKGPGSSSGGSLCCVLGQVRRWGPLDSSVCKTCRFLCPNTLLLNKPANVPTTKSFSKYIPWLFCMIFYSGSMLGGGGRSVLLPYCTVHMDAFRRNKSLHQACQDLYFSMAVRHIYGNRMG